MDSKKSDLSGGIMNSETLARPISRRTVLKRGAILGLSVPVVSTLLAACADSDDADEDDAAAGEDDDAEEGGSDETDDAEQGDDDAAEEGDSEDPDDADQEDAEDDEDSEEAATGGVVRVVMPQLTADPTTMSPLFTQGGHEQAITTLHFGGLLKMDDTLTPVPDLTDSWEISDDAVIYRFELLEDAQWSDGEPVTSEDVVFTFETILNPDVGSSRTAQPMQILGGEAYFDGEADSIEGITAPDDKTIEIELEGPNAIWALQLHSLTGQGIIPKHIYGDIEPAALEGHELSRNPEVGAGSFQLSRWETEQFLEFTANENYVHGRPSIDRIEMMLMLPEAGLAQLETGEMDLVNVPFNELERSEGLEGVEVMSGPSVSHHQLMVNTSREYLSIPVRQAMMYALDHQGIVDAVYQGMATPINTTVIGPEEWMGTIEEIEQDADLTVYEYDPDRAMEILEEEGWDPNQPVELIYATSMEDELAAWTLIQENLRAVGIDLQLTQVEFPTLRELRADGEYDLIVLRGGIPMVDPGTRMPGFTPEPDGSENNIRYHNERIIELEAAGLATTDPEERREVYLEAAKILNEELPHIWLWSPYINFGVSERLSGFMVPGHFSNIVWNANEWTVSG